MFQTVKDTFRRFDYVQLLILIILSAISFFAIYSAVYDPATDTVQDHPFKQVRMLGLALACYVAISFIGYKRLAKWAPILYVIGCLVLFAVIIRGSLGMGAQRWLVVGPVRFQPSEFFKFVWVLMLAWVFSDLQPFSLGFIKLLKKVIWLLPPFLLVFIQPDLGTSMVYIAVWGLVVIFLGVKRIVVILTIVGIIISAPIMWGQLEDYQRLRVISFLSPEKDPGGGGYQAIQARIAIGSGGMTGKGYLNGTQSHLRFMPERHTDFIFAVINEEFGLAGGAFIILLFIMLILRVIFLAMHVGDAQGKIICVAAAGLIFFQFFVNVSMTMGIMPVVGIPLPFISSGGSSLVTFVSILGLVNSVYIDANTAHPMATGKPARLLGGILC